MLKPKYQYEEIFRRKPFFSIVAGVNRKEDVIYIHLFKYILLKYMHSLKGGSPKQLHQMALTG